jgi:hypothetical protein
MIKENETSYFEFFSGYVPSGESFLMAANEIVEIATKNTDTLNFTKNKLCIIGLVSYFEAFVKDHFSSILSIAPVLIEKVKHVGYSTDIPAEEAFEFRNILHYKIGFLIGQRLDFGTAKKINTLYTAVIKITPFGRSEANQFDRLLRDRNLIVHHGGTYTTSYVKQAFSEIDPEHRRPHGDTLEIPVDKVVETALFLKAIASSTIVASSNNLRAILSSENRMSMELEKAIDAMQWWSEKDGKQKGKATSENTGVRPSFLTK